MPTHEEWAAFLRAWKKMDPAEQAMFMAAVTEFKEWLSDQSKPPPPKLRLHTVDEHPVYGPVWSLTWDANGRALFLYGPEQHAGEPHIIWTLIGSHKVYR
jgi:hypothetical protein